MQWDVQVNAVIMFWHGTQWVVLSLLDAHVEKSWKQGAEVSVTTFCIWSLQLSFADFPSRRRKKQIQKLENLLQKQRISVQLCLETYLIIIIFLILNISR